MLTVPTAALLRYAELRGAQLKGRRLRIAVPFSMRPNGNSDGMLGNQISFLPVSIPLDIQPAGKLLSAVHEQMEFLKNVHAAEFVGMAGTLLGAIPLTLQALAGPVASQLPISLCNTICTNVRGPEVPLYLFGHKMLSSYPYVPIGGEMGLNCAMMSYNGTAFFGFTGDAHAAPHLERLGKFLAQSFAEVQKAAGTGPPQRKRPRRKVATAAEPAANVPPGLALAATA